MTDLDQLAAAGARALALARFIRQHPYIPQDEIKDIIASYPDEIDSKAYLAAILPLLAEDLAGVLSGMGTNYDSNAGERFAQAIRTRLTQLGEKQ